MTTSRISFVISVSFTSRNSLRSSANLPYHRQTNTYSDN